MSATEVEKITAGVAATTIKDDASTVAAAEGRRLYIGNLAYTTTEDQLKDFFKGYTIESVSIPVNPRTSRAVGYAFVDVAKKEEADKAITDLSGKEILERKVSVQVARKPGAAPATNGESSANENGRERRQAPRRGRGGMRGGRGPGGRFRRRSDPPRAATKDESAAATTEAAPADAPAATTTEAKTEGASGEETDKTRAPRRKRGPPENGVASTTKVMVANLPYELGEAALKDLFAAYQPESAKIALRPIPRFMVRKLQARGEARKGRGFGFVTLPTEEMQKKAVEEMNGKVVEGREIAVKVAIDNPKDEEEGENEAGDAPANGDATATEATPAATA
ncbi:hypothetical protein AA313_de0201596 [Arthrobotrys entomopaga]|nr:hypothetical protein AA313_de0201596 [Arthrobotrys entomopaga]